jgi:hypothetical protein
MMNLEELTAKVLALERDVLDDLGLIAHINRLTKVISELAEQIAEMKGTSVSSVVTDLRALRGYDY